MSDEQIAVALRRQVADRARHCCEYCGAQARYSSDTLTIDHIVPRALGGSSEETNLALACTGAISIRASRHPRAIQSANWQRLCFTLASKNGRRILRGVTTSQS